MLETMVCNKHPHHHQQPGVCSCCLREKLSHLSLSSDPTRSKIRTLVAVSSGSNSPVHHHHHHHQHRHRRHASTGGSLSFIISTNNTGLKKSRSIAFIASNTLIEHDDDDDEISSTTKHKGGFWKKLIRSTGKGTKKVLMHSRTVKQKSDELHHF